MEHFSHFNLLEMVSDCSKLGFTVTSLQLLSGVAVDGAKHFP